MQLQKGQSSTTPLTKPQVHSRKCHHTYSATRHLPRALWIRSLRFSDADFNQTLDLSKECTLFYEIILYYDHNRACTIFRTPDDIRMLKSGIGTLPVSHGNDSTGSGSRGSSSSSSSSSSSISSNCDGEMVPWRQPVVDDVEVLQQYLREAISKRASSCALEYFLRRRMEDCGGGG